MDVKNVDPLLPGSVYISTNTEHGKDGDELLDRILEHQSKKKSHYNKSGRRVHRRAHDKITFTPGLDGQTEEVGKNKMRSFNNDSNMTESDGLRHCSFPPRHRQDLKSLKPTHKCFHPRHHHTHHQSLPPDPHHKSTPSTSCHHSVSDKTSVPNSNYRQFSKTHQNTHTPALNISSQSYNGFRKSYPDSVESLPSSPSCYPVNDSPSHFPNSNPSYTGELDRIKRLELLASIYETVKKVTRPPFWSEAAHPATPRPDLALSGNISSEASPSDSPLSEPVMTGSSSSDHSLSGSSEFLVISPAGLGFTWRTRGFSDPQVCNEQSTHNSVCNKKPATSATKMRARRTKNRCVRRSYPSEDQLISPPPGFEGTSSDEDTWRMGRAPARWHSHGSGIDWTKLTKGIKLQDEEPGCMQGVELMSPSLECLENEPCVRSEGDRMVQTDKSRVCRPSTEDNVQVQGRFPLDTSVGDELQTQDHMPLTPTHGFFYLPPASIRDDTVKRKEQSSSPNPSLVLEPSRGDMTPIGTVLVNTPQKRRPLKDSQPHHADVHVGSHGGPKDQVGSTRGNRGEVAFTHNVLRQDPIVGRYGRSSKDEDEDLNALLLSLEIFTIAGRANDTDFGGFYQDTNGKAKLEKKTHLDSDLSSSRCVSDKYLDGHPKSLASSLHVTSQRSCIDIPSKENYSHVVEKKPGRDKKTEGNLPACVSSGLQCLGLQDCGRPHLDSAKFKPSQNFHKDVPGPWRTDDINALQRPQFYSDTKMTDVPAAVKSREEGWLKDVLKLTESRKDVRSEDSLLHSTSRKDVEIQQRSPVLSNLGQCGQLQPQSRDSNSQIRYNVQQCNDDSVQGLKGGNLESYSTIFDRTTANKCRGEVESKSLASYGVVNYKPNSDSSTTTNCMSEGDTVLQIMKDSHLDDVVNPNISHLSAEIEIQTCVKEGENVKSTTPDNQRFLDTLDNSSTIEVGNDIIRTDTKSHLENVTEVKEINQTLSPEINKTLKSFHGDGLQGVTGRHCAKVNYQRSKSLHRDEGRGKGGAEGSENMALSGSLRELAHLNIDVSQRLVDGERVFLVKNGSPDLQVVVNSLTPVLSRRRRARNSARSGRQASGEGHTSPLTDSQKPVFECDVGEAASRTVSSLACGQSQDSEEQLPMFVRLRSHEGSPRPCSPLIHVTTENNVEVNVSPCHVSEKLSHKPNAMDNEILNGLEAIKETLRLLESKSGLGPNTAPSYDELTEELENSKSSLFLSPKLSHTWHGQSETTRHRVAPRMGIGQIIAEAAKTVPRPVASSSGNANTHQQSQTLPVISRTLLDAMHKRYCSHQYSRHSHSLKPFTILKIDPASSARNQPITALRVEPCSVRNHEVHAAPPSPQFIARLRKLNSEFKATASGLMSSDPRPTSHALRLQRIPRREWQQRDAGECIGASSTAHPTDGDFVMDPKTERQHAAWQDSECESNNRTTTISRSTHGLEEMLNHGHKQAGE